MGATNSKFCCQCHGYYVTCRGVTSSGEDERCRDEHGEKKCCDHDFDDDNISCTPQVSEHCDVASLHSYMEETGCFPICPSKCRRKRNKKAYIDDISRKEEKRSSFTFQTAQFPDNPALFFSGRVPPFPVDHGHYSRPQSNNTSNKSNRSSVNSGLQRAIQRRASDVGLCQKHMYSHRRPKAFGSTGCVSRHNRRNPRGVPPFPLDLDMRGEKENLSKNHNSYMMSTTTQNGKEEWLRVMKKVMKGPPGGGIFGQELMRTIQYEEEVDSKSPHNGKRIKKEAPYIIIKCCEFIRSSGGFYEEGLFRLPGQANEVKELQDSFDMGERPDFDKSTDIHTVTSLMKSFLRELPEPLVPFNLYSPLIDSAKVVNPGSQQSSLRKTNSTSGQENEEPEVLKCREIIKSNLQLLPKANFNLLRYLCRFLDEVQQHSEQNKMDVANLALMFGPNIMRAEKEEPMSMMSDSTYVQYIMSEFIQNHKYLFPDDDPNDVREILPQSSIPDVAADAASRHLRNSNAMTSSPAMSPRYHNAFTDTTAQTSTEGFNTMTTQTTTSPPGTMGLRHVTDDSGTGSLGPTPDNTSRRTQPPHLGHVKHRNGANRPTPASAIYEEVANVPERPHPRPALPAKPVKPLRPSVSNDIDRRQSFYDNVTQSSETSSFAGKHREWRRSDDNSKFTTGPPSQRSSYVNQTSPGISSQRSSTNAVAGSSIAESFNSFDGDTLPYSPTPSVHESQMGRRIPLNDVENSKGPKPPARKRRSKKNNQNSSPQQQQHNRYISDEESNTESVPPDDRSEIRSIRSSRNGSVSSINDTLGHPRGYRSYSAPKRPTTRPPPPPYSAGQRQRSQTQQDRQQTYEELQEDVRILQERLQKQSGEYEARTRFMEEQLTRHIQELRSTSISYCDQQSSVFRTESGRLSSTMSEFETSPGHCWKSNANEDARSYMSSIADTTTSAPIHYDTVTGRYDIEPQLKSPKDFKTQEEHLQYLQKCVTEERKLRQMTEIALKNEKRGRIDAEERNNQLQREMKEFFFTFGSMFSNSETSSVR